MNTIDFCTLQVMTSTPLFLILNQTGGIQNIDINQVAEMS